MTRVFVVGGGIAGLTAALELSGLDTTLVEAEDHLGGKIGTAHVDGFVIEAGADSVLAAKPAALELCERLGLTDDLVNTRKENNRTYVYSRGRLRLLPEGLVLGSPARAGALLRSGLLSPAGAARMAADVVVRRRRGDGDDETIASFFTRRLGRQAYERVVEPLLAGIHAGDATQLSLRATFPRFAEMERDHGGLVRATLATRRRGGSAEPAPHGHTPFVSLQRGMGQLTDALAGALEHAGVTLRTGERATELRRKGSGPGYELRLSSGPALDADAVVLATPAHTSAELLRRLCPSASAELAAIPHASTATVSLAYAGQEPEGYGFVVPRAEGRQLIAATWSSSKWPGRAPPGQALVRGYVGGIGRDAVLDGDDDALIRLVRNELAALAGITGEPVHAEVHRYPLGMPQYTLGHLERVQRIRTALATVPGLYVTGAAYGGVGIPDCVTDATTTARAVLARSRSVQI